MPDQGPPPSRPACLKPFLQKATTPSAHDWPGAAIAVLTLLTPQRRSRSPAAQRKSDGVVSARALSARHARAARRTARRILHTRRPRRQAIIILRTTDDICHLPQRLPSPAAAHTTSAPIARFCLLACCRTLSSRSAAAAAAVTFTLCLTLSAPGKERRARALVESHSLTCGGGTCSSPP